MGRSQNHRAAVEEKGFRGQLIYYQELKADPEHIRVTGLRRDLPVSRKSAWLEPRRRMTLALRASSFLPTFLVKATSIL